MDPLGSDVVAGAGIRVRLLRVGARHDPPHPFDPDHDISDRLIEVAETVISSLNPTALWMASREGAAKNNCLSRVVRGGAPESFTLSALPLE